MIDLTRLSHLRGLSKKRVKRKYHLAASRLANEYLYACGDKPANHPVPALYAKTVWFPEGSPYVACPGIPYVNLLAYNGASNGIRHGYYTLKRYYIFWDSVVDYLTY